MTAYATFTVAFEIVGSNPDTREFESVEEAFRAYNEIDLAYEFLKIHRTAGWSATRNMILVKSLDMKFYDEDGNELDIIADSLYYEEYSTEDFLADEG